MLSRRAFRAQLVVQGQRMLFDYWLSAAGSRQMPARSDIDPQGVTKLLPHIGLIDVANGLEEARFRLAGTKLHDIYGREITGQKLGQVFSGGQSDYWRRAHERILETGAPHHGVVRGPAEGRDHIVLFWLRLPLSQDGLCVDRILCLDFATPVETAKATNLPPQRRYTLLPVKVVAEPHQIHYS
jgi:hypothetical protein